MCRYAFSGPYKRHFACFACRKAFKQPPIEDYLSVQGRGHIYQQLAAVWSNASELTRLEEELGLRLEDLRADFHAAQHKCPECGGLMADLGLDFKPPKQTDVRAWKAIAGMYRVGHEWWTCGCNGPGWVPQSPSEFKKYLVNRKAHYENQLRHSKDGESIGFWGTQVQAIERELAAI